MKNLPVICSFLVIAGCFGPAKFDASNKASIETSTNRIIESLPETKRTEFLEALKYFSAFGDMNIYTEEDTKDNQSTIVFDKPRTVIDDIELAMNLKFLDGLTGVQIIEKHQKIIEDVLCSFKK